MMCEKEERTQLSEGIPILEERIKILASRITKIEKKIEELDYWQIKLCAKHGIE